MSEYSNEGPSSYSFSVEERGEFDDLLKLLADLFALRESADNRKLWYRGHTRACYHLCPSIGRKGRYLGHPKVFDLSQERELLHRFRRRVYHHENRMLHAGEALFLARHHGLPTRLLDWTANALYGVWFACHDHIKDNGHLWALRKFDDAKGIDGLELASTPTEDQLLVSPVPWDAPLADDEVTPESVRIVNPLYNSRRIIAQDGAFTLHTNPRRSLDDYSSAAFIPGHLDIAALYRWTIQANAKRRLVEQLAGLGLTRRSLFPDLEGIASSLWETEALWPRAKQHALGRDS